MATIVTTSELKVLDKYNELVQQSLGADGVYIRTKETLEALLQAGELKDADRATVIVQVLTGLNSSLVSTSMQTALQWTAQEKELEFKKLELQLQLDILTTENKLKEAQIDNTKSQDLATQAGDLRQNGVSTVIDGKVVALNNSGVHYENILATRENVKGTTKNTELATAKIQETYAGVHKLVADTYNNFGAYSGYTVTGTGIVGITDVTPASYETLADKQREIAGEQAKGYSYNAWANAASSSASMLGVLLSTETEVIDESDVALWRDAVTKLKNIQVP